MKKETKILHTIDLYIAGKLQPVEIDRLWIQMLKSPDYYEYLVMMVNLEAIIRRKMYKI
ncbi:MAG TPA: hypothetical protein VJ991_06435 [Balneolales bacterium]|nr:hypothetical protein [Balneolales bacterium]